MDFCKFQSRKLLLKWSATSFRTSLTSQMHQLYMSATFEKKSRGIVVDICQQRY